MASAWPSSSRQLVLRLLDPWLKAALRSDAASLSSGIIYDGELPLLGPPPAGEPADGKAAAGEPPDGEADGGLLLGGAVACGGPRPAGAARRVGGHLVAADWAGVAEREPGEDAVGVVDVGAGHLPGLGAELEGLLADGAVGFGGDPGGVDGDDGHGLDGGLGGRRVVAGAGEAAGLDLRELVEEALEAGAHEEVGHALGERAEARTRAVVVEELEAASRGRCVCRVGVPGGGAAEHDDGVEGRGAGVGAGAPRGSSAAGAAETQVGGGGGVVVVVVVVVRARAAEVGGPGRGRAHLLEEAAAAGGAGNGGSGSGGRGAAVAALRRGADEAVALVAPVGRRGGGRGRGGHRKGGTFGPLLGRGAQIWAETAGAGRDLLRLGSRSGGRTGKGGERERQLIAGCWWLPEPGEGRRKSRGCGGGGGGAVEKEGKKGWWWWEGMGGEGRRRPIPIPPLCCSMID
ncbi:hypothetical protein SETIT_3G066800v2 [Setaria italica]|uniref:Uncharacterized protein n=1 Tax=Setaria italica TaxID=4555 RepID=A0A368QCX8_SETIT|nr:hypothetical protein SETIT_3G066800v2 [Setaria italica]